MSDLVPNSADDLITDEEVSCVNRLSKEGGYWSPDLAPVPPSARTWGLRDIVSLWVALSACIPTYMLASSLIEEGMNWWQAVLTIFLGNLIVLIPIVLNAHAGTKYGIPFPVLCRSSFGLRGANVPALLRALVACGWFGIQCWIGSHFCNHLPLPSPSVLSETIEMQGISMSECSTGVNEFPNACQSVTDSLQQRS